MPRNWNPFPKDECKCTDIPYTKQQLHEFFKQHDKNGNNLLSKEELKKAFDDLQSRNPGFRAWRAMGKADADGDQHISQQEMEALLDYAVGIKYQIKA
ncbi:hypothetical protein CK203_024695 [Vitis vinifera]|uniref:EF-hand domain-containing protein n=2 Tax=Vitis vinifera TaxID=29760 RepID=A0A438IT60_VITVI|nr:hypothetical protein CK203_081448 [Vitis vinifera]RVW99906.1 hypothetical protein CK203_024695 [Vitis vinifera]CAN63003.1 hypothetical protein VITISV_004363 [Vitis vinifera]